MNTIKEARRDAEEFARAQMAYGEGAGTRRKLIAATVQAKQVRDPIYDRAFRAAYAGQDMAEHASKARRERHIKDTTSTVSKTVKHIATGNHENLKSSIFVVVVVGTAIHQSGLDKVVLDQAKFRIAQAKAWNRERKVRNKVTHLFVAR